MSNQFTVQKRYESSYGTIPLETDPGKNHATIGAYYVDTLNDKIVVCLSSPGSFGARLMSDAVSFEEVKTVEHIMSEADKARFVRVKDTEDILITCTDDSRSTDKVMVVSGARNHRMEERRRRYGQYESEGRQCYFQPGLGPSGYATPTASASSAHTVASSVIHVDDMNPVALKSQEPEPNLISSKLENGRHKPVLDIDLPISLIRSTTPGRYHMFIDKEMDDDEYFHLLDVLVVAGLVEEGYAAASKARGASFVRLTG